ncbi:transposase [Lentibacillus sp. CBA3610]|uniref:transposase n=1 Tax=Lentibacillus sp. CBA3610 TaxID=2518176 RepID=UPI0015958F89|nr:transposase [Lentibacillus sp. CBA3610]QKY70159.1 transposase [Lentibacillus sp. CBA3610]
MPYKKRVYVPERFYHIVSRGNRRDPLFRYVGDYRAFLHILLQLYEKHPFELASYCFMTNHYHLQIRSKEISISKLMALINKRYANYYNTKYSLSGHVYEKRFFDKMIDDRAGMLEVSRYIHLNPIEAKIVKLPENYPWSSYRYYKNKDNKMPVFMNLASLLDFFDGTERQKREKYCNAVWSQ